MPVVVLSAWPHLWPLLLAFGLGGATVLAFAPFHFGWLAPFTLALLLYLLEAMAPAAGLHTAAV